MPTPCARCGYANTEHAVSCGLCGTALVAAAEGPFRLPADRRLPAPDPAAARTLRVPVGWVHLGAGLLIALVFTLTPALRFMGWLLGSLFHETGHVVFAWFVGCPAWPAISLQGHAAAFHKPQSAAVLVGIGLLLGIGVWQAWRAGRWRGLATGALLLWPVCAFFETPRELGFLLSGHLGELAFGGVFLWRARTGEAIEREAERPLYASLGWFLVARNVVLCFGLAFVESARAWYHASGSFGLTNDYVRVAQQVIHVPLEAVAIFMLLVSLSVVPLVLAATWRPREIVLPPPPPPKPRGEIGPRPPRTAPLEAPSPSPARDPAPAAPKASLPRHRTIPRLR